MSLGVSKSKADSKIYFKVEDGRPVIVPLYVDDMFLTRVYKLIVDAKRKLATEFEMNHTRMMHYFLGMEVWQSTDGIFLGQRKYAVEILKRFRMLYYKAMATPMESNLKLLIDGTSKKVDAMMYRQMIGSLMYLTNTRPDICFAVNTLSQFLTDPRHVHLIAAKHILRYLKGTMDYGIKYDVNQNINLHGYVDSYWEGSTTDKKKTSGCCFSLGYSRSLGLAGINHVLN